MCFNPRHGIRAKKTDQVLDLVICFECEKLYAYKSDGIEHDTVQLKRSAQPILDDVLKEAGIPLARTSDEHDEASQPTR